MENQELEIRNYHRPKTRGELRDKIKEGIECEVVASNASITTHLLAWFGLWKGKHFNVRQSENPGWVIFVPIKKEPPVIINYNQSLLYI